MKKLLHERLYAAAEDYIRTGDVCHIDVAGKPIYMPSNLANALAEEIEKYYIPRPRFEDGEPVQFGDEFADCSGNPHTLHEIRYRDKAAAGLGAKCLLEANTTSPKDYDGISFNLWDGQTVKRPEPKVLDADGVEIKVGETVWCVYHTERFVVEDIHEASGVMFVNVRGDGEHRTCFKPHELSHREPDSLEKLLERMESYAQKNEGYVDGSKVGDFSKELRAIMERDA